MVLSMDQSGAPEEILTQPHIVKIEILKILFRCMISTSTISFGIIDNINASFTSSKASIMLFNTDVLSVTFCQVSAFSEETREVVVSAAP